MGLLDGVTVLDLASVGPAARASRWLADYGASVVKVGPVPSRADVHITPPAHAYSGGRATRRVLLDLKATSGRAVFLRLASTADVVIESFRPGVVARLGIGYDDVKGHNPRIVYCSTSGYGQTGPWAGWAGHDLNYLAVSGFLAHTEPTATGKPALPGTTVADTAGGGLQAVAAILAALVARGTTGEGCFLDVSVAEGMLALMALQVDDYLATGNAAPPGSAPLAGRYACYDVYRAADGRWLSVAAIEHRFWANLCAATGLTQWADRQYDDTAQDDIRRDLGAAFATRPRDAWVTALSPADTCVAPVLSIDEAAVSDQAAARGAIADADHPRAGALRQLAPLLAGAERARTYALPDPAGTDTDDVLAAAGFTADDVAALRSEGVIA
jgi:alpha-methylacyl-CoA racemase